MSGEGCPDVPPPLRWPSPGSVAVEELPVPWAEVRRPELGTATVCTLVRKIWYCSFPSGPLRMGRGSGGFPIPCGFSVGG